ncbi:MAG TPA: IPT/TIG domain-containing protein [Bryobacteraceae bacterium]|nr:IPT/TIG domain-containing protein [Bryobacteraceae bacterium]
MALRKSSDNRPQISQVTPPAAIAGGELQIRGRGFVKSDRPRVTIGDVAAPVIIGSDSFIIARVPDGASAGELVIENGEQSSESWACDVGVLIADSLHPVSNPAVDSFGNIYTTFSGSRGQKVPVAVYKVDLNFTMKPFINDLMNATGLAFDHEGFLYISSRYDGMVYQVSPNGNMSTYVEGMGVATGMAFDSRGNLYVGDRSGTIFKISPNRQIFVFTTLEPSIAAYHLAFGPDDYLYVTGPTTSSFDAIHRVSQEGEVSVFYRGLGRPQGLAFDDQGRLYAAASISGRKGIVRIYPDQRADLFVSGPGIVGLAFSPSRAMIIATTNALYRIDAGIKGRPLAG